MRGSKTQISDQGEQQHEDGERSPVHLSHGISPRLFRLVLFLLV
jgi:hypothetical protein